MTGFEMILPFLRPIQAHILDPDVSEIMVNGPGQVFVERGGYLEQIEGVTLNEKSLMVAVKNIARRLGDDISEEKPILDSRLPDGSRVAAVIPPCSLNGIALTIRKFNARHLGLAILSASERSPRSWPPNSQRRSAPERTFSSRAGPEPARPRCSTFSPTSFRTASESW